MHSDDRPIQATPEGAVGAHLSALDDMEAIFGRPEPGRTAAPAALALVPPRRRRPSSAVIAGLVALIAVALVFLVRTPGQTMPVPAPAGSAVIGARPSMAAAPAAAAAVEELDSTPVVIARPAGAPSEAAARGPQPAPAATNRPSSPASGPAAPRPDAAPREQQPARDGLAGASLARAPDPCSTRANQGRPDCLGAALRRADFALRRAYYAAAEADVAPAALRHYRREWDRVRLYAVEDPEGTIDDYEGMTRDLNSLADRSGSDDIDDRR